MKELPNDHSLRNGSDLNLIHQAFGRRQYLSRSCSSSSRLTGSINVDD
jgi:hypothetical protein